MLWIYIILGIFIVLGTLHYRVGYDFPGYERFYDYLSPLNYLSRSEIENSRFAPGFIILASFTKLFSREMIVLNFVYSSFVCGVATWFFYKNTKKIFFALLMFFLFSYTLLIFEQIREAIAVGFFVLAWPFFEKRKWIYWYALSFCAIMFHTSATIMFVLPLILLPGVKQLFVYGKRTYIICSVVLVAAFILQVTFSKYIELLAVTQAMEDMTKAYANTHYVKGNLNIMGIMGQLIRSVVYPLLAMLCLASTNKKRGKERRIRDLEMFVLISIYISLLSIGVPIISRFNNYFFFFPIVIVSDWVFENIKIKNRKVRFNFAYWVLILLPMFFSQFYSYYYTPVNKSGTYKLYMGYYPYTTYLDKAKDANKEKVLSYSRRHKR